MATRKTVRKTQSTTRRASTRLKRPRRVLYREATAFDLFGILECWPSGWEPLNGQKTTEIAKEVDRGRYVVGVASGKIVAWYWWDSDFSTDTLLIRGAAVHPEYQRSGLFVAGAKHHVELANQLNARQAVVMMRDEDLKVLGSTIEKMGFVRIGTVEGLFAEDEDIHFFALRGSK